MNVVNSSFVDFQKQSMKLGITHTHPLPIQGNVTMLYVQLSISCVNGRFFINTSCVISVSLPVVIGVPVSGRMPNSQFYFYNYHTPILSAGEEEGGRYHCLSYHCPLFSYGAAWVIFTLPFCSSWSPTLTKKPNLHSSILLLLSNQHALSIKLS